MVQQTSPQFDPLADAKALSGKWEARTRRMLATRELLKIRERPKKEGYETFDGNGAKVDFEGVKSVLSRGYPIWEFPIFGDSKEEADKKNDSERFAGGVFREVNKRHIARGGEYILRDMANQVCEGWYSVFPEVRKGKNGTAEFWLHLYDPVNVFQEYGEYGLVTVTSNYKTDYAHALSLCEYFNKGKPNESDHIKVVNWWKKVGDKVYNAIYVDSKAIKEPKEENFLSIPILTGPVGGMPIAGDDYSVLRGQSIIDGAAEIYPAYDRVVELAMNIMAMNAWGIRIFHSDDRSFQEENQQNLGGTGLFLNMGTQEKLEVLNTGMQTLGELDRILSVLANQRSMATLPPEVLGASSAGMSGYHYAQRRDMISQKYGAQIHALEWLLGEAMLSWIWQFRSGGLKPVTLEVQKGELEKAKYYVEKFDAKQIPETTHIKPKLNVAEVVRDQLQDLLQANNLTTGPIASTHTARKVAAPGLIEDDALEDERILREMVYQLPEVQLGLAVTEIEDNIDAENARGNEKEAQRWQRILDMVDKQGMSTRSAAGKAPRTTVGAEAGMTPQVTGVTPEAMRKAAGAAPPGHQREPQTPEVRNERRRQGVT